MEEYYQPVYDLQGKLTRYNYDVWQFWCDACWDRAIPEDTKGFTYFEVGCNEGLYLLRFMQRGGLSAIGLDIDKSPEDFLRWDRFRNLKKMYNNFYVGFKGGFTESGEIIPTVASSNIVACMNVIEYTQNPKRCIQSMLDRTISRLIIATDITDKETHREGSQWRFNAYDLIMWLKYSTTVWIDTLGNPPQGFFITDLPDFSLPKFDETIPMYDKSLRLTETQKRYLKRTK